jgi:hypothetical protein
VASFAVFFESERAFGIQPVEALNSDQAADMVHAQHPGARLAVMTAAQLEGVGEPERHQLLADWARNGGVKPPKGDGVRRQSSCASALHQSFITRFN